MPTLKVGLMNVGEVCTVLSNDTRRRVLSIVLSEEPISSRQVHQIFQENYEDLRRETIYKALEQLVSCGLLEKHYETGEGLKYQVIVEQVKLDFSSMEASPIELNSVKDNDL